jgi:hypothetical protein
VRTAQFFACFKVGGYCFVEQVYGTWMVHETPSLELT